MKIIITIILVLSLITAMIGAIKYGNQSKTIIKEIESELIKKDLDKNTFSGKIEPSELETNENAIRMANSTDIIKKRRNKRTYTNEVNTYNSAAPEALNLPTWDELSAFRPNTENPQKYYLIHYFCKLNEDTHCSFNVYLNIKTGDIYVGKEYSASVSHPFM